MQREELFPLTKEDYLKIAKKYNDKALIKKIMTDPTFKPWENK
jgi:hypothetical protein